MAKSASKRKNDSKHEDRSKRRPIAKQQPALDNEVLAAGVGIKDEPDDQRDNAQYLFRTKWLSHRYYQKICDEKIFNQEMKKCMQSYDQDMTDSFLLNIYQQCHSVVYQNCDIDNTLWEKTNEMYQNILSQPILQLDCMESKQNVVLPTENVSKCDEMYQQYDYIEGCGLILPHYIPEAIKLKKQRKKKKGKDEVTRMILNRLKELKKETNEKEIVEQEEVIAECPNADNVAVISPITVVKISNGIFKIKKNDEDTINNSIEFDRWDKLIGAIFNDEKDKESYKQLFEDIWTNKEKEFIFTSDAVKTEPPSVAKLSLIFIEEDVLAKYNPLNPCMILKISKSAIIRECLINLLEELQSIRMNLIFLAISFSKMYQQIKGWDNGVESFYRFYRVLKVYMKTIDKSFSKYLMNKDYTSFLILCDYIIGGVNSWMFIRQETKDYDTLTDCLKKAYKYYEFAKHINYDIGCWAISSNSSNINTLSSNGPTSRLQTCL